MIFFGESRWGRAALAPNDQSGIQSGLSGQAKHFAQARSNPVSQQFTHASSKSHTFSLYFQCVQQLLFLSMLNPVCIQLGHNTCQCQLTCTYKSYQPSITWTVCHLVLSKSNNLVSSKERNYLPCNVVLRFDYTRLPQSKNEKTFCTVIFVVWNKGREQHVFTVVM